MPDLEPVNFYKFENNICIDGNIVETSFDYYLNPFSGSRFGEYVHSHSRHEVHIPGETGLNIMIGRKILEIQHGKIVIIAPNVYHTCLPENYNKRSFLYSFKEQSVNGFTAPLNFKDDYVVFNDSFNALNTIYKIEKVYQFADNGCKEQAGYLFSSLLIDFARALAKKINPDAPCQESQKPYIKHESTVNLVSGNTRSINLASGNASSINSASRNASSVNSASGNASSINSASGNASSVNLASGNASSVNPLASISTAINPITIMDLYFTIIYNNQFQKKRLAKMLSVSERQLERIIFNTYGMTFKEKVQKTRLDMANNLIIHFGYSIAKTAEIIGYSSEQSFYRAYKKYFGISPHKYMIRKY